MDCYIWYNIASITASNIPSTFITLGQLSILKSAEEFLHSIKVCVASYNSSTVTHHSDANDINTEAVNGTDPE